MNRGQSAARFAQRSAGQRDCGEPPRAELPQWDAPCLRGHQGQIRKLIRLNNASEEPDDNQTLDQRRSYLNSTGVPGPTAQTALIRTESISQSLC